MMQKIGHLELKCPGFYWGDCTLIFKLASFLDLLKYILIYIYCSLFGCIGESVRHCKCFEDFK